MILDLRGLSLYLPNDFGMDSRLHAPSKHMRAWVVAGILWMVTISSGAHASAQDVAFAAETPARGLAQAASSSADPSIAPINPSLRVRWLLDGAVGFKSLIVVGPLSAAWETAWNQPEEWGHSWSGFGKRYLEREADVAIANTIEAGLGAIWGEDPRFVPSHKRGIWPRAGFAIKTTFVAPGRDGRFRPAWGRYAGKTVKNVIENEWLPPSARTTKQMLLRTAQGFAGRLLGNLWDEFWPDVRDRLRRRQ